jgi:hypothetical protein
VTTEFIEASNFIADTNLVEQIKKMPCLKFEDTYCGFGSVRYVRFVDSAACSGEVLTLGPNRFN